MPRLDEIRRVLAAHEPRLLARADMNAAVAMVLAEGPRGVEMLLMRRNANRRSRAAG